MLATSLSKKAGHQENLKSTQASKQSSPGMGLCCRKLTAARLDLAQRRLLVEKAACLVAVSMSLPAAISSSALPRLVSSGFPSYMVSKRAASALSRPQKCDSSILVSTCCLVASCASHQMTVCLIISASWWHLRRLRSAFIVSTSTQTAQLIWAKCLKLKQSNNQQHQTTKEITPSNKPHTQTKHTTSQTIKQSNQQQTNTTIQQTNNKRQWARMKQYNKRTIRQSRIIQTIKPSNKPHNNTITNETNNHTITIPNKTIKQTIQ